MGSEWPDTLLEELADEVTVGFVGSMTSEYVDDGIPFFRSKNVNPYKLNWDDVRYVSREFHEKIKKSSLGPGDVVIVRTGKPGTACMIPDDVEEANCSDLVIVRPGPNLDKRFLVYFLNSAAAHHINANLVGAVQQHFNVGAAKKLSIPLPPLPEQKAIAHILGTLDDKIELNRRMNATLEGMAQALFKSWFVDFDPVIDNALAAGNPIPDELAPRAKVRLQALANTTTQQGSVDHQTLSDPKSLFPDAFEFNDELGWIPKGWTLQSFESLATLDTESVKPFEQPSTVWEHYSIPSYDSSGMPSWDRGDEIKSNKYRVKPGAILSSKLNPETERTWWPFMLDGETAICSTEFMQFVPKNRDEQTFVYSLIRSEPFQARILERVTGSTGSRQRAQPKEIAKIGVPDCGESLRAEFVKVALPLFQSVRNNSLRNQTLTKLRDTLLPKLISGELRITEAEQLTEDALA